MNTPISTIKSYIVSRLLTLGGISAAYGFENPSQESYPFATCILKDWSGTFITNGQHERHYVFTIRIYQDYTVSNIGPEQAEANLIQLADQINALFDNDNQLNTQVVFCMPIGGRTGYVQDVPIRTYEFDLEVVDIVTAAQ